MINFLDSIIDLLSSFLSIDYLSIWFFPFLALAFVATVPIIIRKLITWR